MITASYIIETLVNPKDEKESLLYLTKLLDKWSQRWKQVKQSEFLILKRYIPDIMYTGPLFRLVVFDKGQFNKTDLDSIRQFLGTDKSRLGRYSSWSKSLTGITQEVGKRTDIGHGRDQLAIIFQTYTTGLDLSKVVNYLFKEHQKYLKDDEFMEYLWYKVKSSIRDLRDDFNSSEEVLASFNPSDIKIISVKSFESISNSDRVLSNVLSKKQILEIGDTLAYPVKIDSPDWGKIRLILGAIHLNFNVFYQMIKPYVKLFDGNLDYTVITLLKILTFLCKEDLQVKKYYAKMSWK